MRTVYVVQETSAMMTPIAVFQNKREAQKQITFLNQATGREYILCPTSFFAPRRRRKAS